MVIKKIQTSAIAVTIFLLSCTVCWSQDWPQWRGPSRDARIADFTVPERWPEKLNKKWTIPVGLGDASPVLVDNRLYTFGREDSNEVVLCIDPSNGGVIWKHVYPARFVATGPSSSHPGPRSTPVVADDKICVLGIGGILSCLDATSGKLLWRKQSEADYQNTPYKFETSMSPIIVKNMCFVYIGGDGKGAIIGFDLTTGKAKWNFTGDAPSPSSPVLMTVDSVKQIVTINEKKVIGAGLSGHKLLWSVPFKSRPVNSTTPVVDGQTVYVTGQGMGILAVKIIRSEDNFDAETVWTNSVAQVGSRYTTPVLKDGLLYGHAGNELICVDTRDGKVLWADASVKGQSCAIVDAGFVLIALGINGDMSVYRPSDTQYIELAHYMVGEPEIWAHPIIAGNQIFIRDKESITLWTIE
ncbi:PQQ-like beta-propeller repeat protein [candidate division KSB1 bacterium]|nr:PQQ-like beta-propeller repeat protein [candidate division KSB1 bacterium]